MSYTYSFDQNTKSSLDPADFISWDMEEETEEESEFDSVFISVGAFDTDEILQTNVSGLWQTTVSKQQTTKEKDKNK